MNRRQCFTIFLILCITQCAIAEDNWTRFRGPDGTGVGTDHPALPMRWSTTDSVRWVADIPGWGWSCPVVTGNRVFLTTVISQEQNETPSKGLYLGQGVRVPAEGIHDWMVYCFDLESGKKLWEHRAHRGKPQVPRHPKSTYAAETPTTDGERLYVLFGDLGLYCYGLDGKLLWTQSIEPRKTFLDYGAAASPVVHQDRVIVVYDNLEDSWIAAFDTKTGERLWRTSRDETHSWATPLVWTNEMRTELVVPGKKSNRGYSLDGKLLWEFDGRMSNLVIPSPFTAHGLCYIASGYIGDNHRPTFALRPGAHGKLAIDGDYANDKSIAWYQPKASPYNPSQIVYGDYLYTLYDRGFLTCHDAQTGEEIYGKRRFVPRGSFTSSPWAYNGHLYFLSEDGLTYVVKAGPEFEIVGTNALEELCLASPAIVGDKLLIRTASALYCLTEGAQLPDEIAKARRNSHRPVDLGALAESGQLKQLVEAINNGARVDQKNAAGMTPLMLAALYGHREIALALLKAGADPNLANRDGHTALHMASFFAYPKIVQALLAKGASPTAKNRQGDSPLKNLSQAWSPELKQTYERISNLIGKDVDLERIQATRPEILKLLEDHSPEKSDSP